MDETAVSPTLDATPPPSPPTGSRPPIGLATVIAAAIILAVAVAVVWWA